MPISPARTFRAVLAACAAVLLVGCSSFGAVNLLVPKSGYSVRHDIAYGPDPRHRLDVYIPDGLKGPTPVLLFFYGGGWQMGARAQYLAFGQAFASQGFVTVIADYRLYPQVRWPAFVEDGAKAVAYVHAHAAQFGGDPNRLFIAGHSAGAYNAITLASDPRYLKAVGGDFSWLRGAIGIAGPYDFLPLTDPNYIAIFHGPNNKDAMPINHIDGPRPPMLLAAGTDDSVVSPGNTTRMATRLKSLGNRVEVNTYKGAGHISIILSLVPGFRGMTTLRDDMTRFIREEAAGR